MNDLAKHTHKVILFLMFLIFGASFTYSQIPNWDWAKGAGDTDQDYATSVATDAFGNIYTVGTFEGNSITFGTTTLTHPGFFDMFLVKYDNSGNVLWAYNPGGMNAASGANSVAVDASGNVYVAGWFASPSITFGTTTFINTLDPGGQVRTDIFLVKFDSNGNVIWARSAVGNDFDRALSVATDTLGNVIVTGYFLGLNITFGSTTLPNTYPYFTTDLFIAKYNGNGNFLWARKAGGTDYEYMTSTTTDALGNCYAGGKFSSPSITFGTTTLTNAGAEGVEDIFLVKYDGSGNALWARSAGGIESDVAASVHSDALGNSYVTGYFTSPSITFGATTLINSNPGIGILYIAKYDAGGNVLWAHSAGDIGGSRATGVFADAWGGVYLAGSFGGPSITFGNVTLFNAGFNDLFLVKYDGNGGVLWGKSVGGSESDFANTVAVDVFGNACVAGSFYSQSISFNTDTLINASLFDDMFIAKIGSGVVPVSGELIPAEYALEQNYPNPFNPTTTINYQIIKNDFVSLKVYDVLGNEVATLVNEEKPAGNYEIHFGAASLSSGTYFYKLQAGSFIETKKMLLLK